MSRYGPWTIMSKRLTGDKPNNQPTYPQPTDCVLHIFRHQIHWLRQFVGNIPQGIHESEDAGPLLDGLLDHDGDPQRHEGLREVCHLCIKMLALFRGPSALFCY